MFKKKIAVKKKKLSKITDQKKEIDYSKIKETLLKQSMLVKTGFYKKYEFTEWG